MYVSTEPRRRVLVIACLGTAAAGVLLAVPFVLMGPSGPKDESYVDGPVIADTVRSAYPLAGITGPLTMEQGCLLIHDEPVFWPHGTHWDASSREVVFPDGGRLGLGHVLNGGGGGVDRKNLAEEPRTTAETAVLECLRRTGADDAVFAYDATFGP